MTPPSLTEPESFKLKISFTCLCFFVPDESNGVMHVLMPATCSHGANDGHVEKHDVSLMYPAPNGGGRLDEQGHRMEAGQPGDYEYMDLKGWKLVLGEGQTPAVTALKIGIPDVSAAAGGVNRALVDTPPDDLIAAQVVLASGENKNNYAAATWTFNGATGPIAQRVVWEMTLPGNTLTWSLRSLAGGEVKPLPDIPVSGGRVKIEIHHTTPECFPVPKVLTSLDADVIAEHFRAYFTLCTPEIGMQTTRRVPEWVEVLEDLPLSCMAGQGKLR